MNDLTKCANIYARYRDQLPDVPEREIMLFQYETKQAFHRLLVPVEFVDGQPYADLEAMSHDITTNNVLKISRDFNDSALLPFELNLKARAVHDFFTLHIAATVHL